MRWPCGRDRKRHPPVSIGSSRAARGWAHQPGLIPVAGRSGCGPGTWGKGDGSVFLSRHGFSKDRSAPFLLPATVAGFFDPSPA